jgi:hypothetical protein
MTSLRTMVVRFLEFEGRCRSGASPGAHFSYSDIVLMVTDDGQKWNSCEKVPDNGKWVGPPKEIKNSAIRHTLTYM